MIRVYQNDCKDFDNNGLGVLVDFKGSPKIKESLNGCFELNFDYALKGKNVEYLVADNIIKAPYEHTEQLFRIKIVKPSMTKISIYAVHIFYDLAENFLVDVRPMQKTGVSAIEWLLDNAVFPTDFKVTGDISEINSAIYIRKNIVDAILGTDNCIVKRWGGEIERDNFNIVYHNRRGQDRGVYIKQGKNIKEIEMSVDFTSIVTRIIPQGANELLLPEVYVDSPIIHNYRNPIIAKIDFNDVTIDANTTETEAYEKLRDKARDQFNKGIDKPNISVKVNWLELSVMEEYKNRYKNLEYVKLGDTVTVQALGYEYKIRVITVEYDCLLKKYINFEIGDPKVEYVSKQNSIFISEIQKNNDSMLQQAKQIATSLINNGFGGHVRIHPDRVLIMDTTDETTAQKVWQWNMNGFGYSKNGINGLYETAITQNGEIIADFITSGTMSASRIKGYNQIETKVIDTEKAVQEFISLLNQTTQKVEYQFSKTGGNNKFRNSIGFDGSNYWEGPITSYSDEEIKRISGQSACLIMQSGTVKQAIFTANGKNVISFKYKKLLLSANCYIKINGMEYWLTETEYTDFERVIDVKDNYIIFEMIANENNCCYIINLMCNEGEVKIPFSLNQNETLSDTVTIGKGIAVSESAINTQSEMTANMIGFKDKITGNVKSEWNADRMTVPHLTTMEASSISGAFFYKKGKHVCMSGL